ncbi:hypothetical protein HPP92_009645 [Vanilla planifolia]|nr:hypothetical protein HPP92_009645 [Vanilla planifolia]
MGKFKPFYFKASKLRFLGSINDRFATQVGETDQSHLVSSLPSRFKVAGGQLRKNRSASSVVVSVSSSRLLVPRRDDTLLQQEDGIQSAIAHCKRSFHAGNGASELLLSRSMSYPGGEKSIKEVRGESFRTENSTVF